MLTGNLSLKDSESSRDMVVRTLVQWIGDGVLPGNTMVPPERELCRRLGVSQRTVQRAFEILESEKIVLRKGPRTRIVAGRSKANEGARSLLNTVLVFSNTLAPDPRHGAGWSDAILKGILEGLALADLHALVFNSKHVDREIGRLLEQKPFGILLGELPADGAGCNPLDRLLKSGAPAVAYGNDEKFGGVDRVASDHESGAFELTRSLIARGRKRIMMLGSTNCKKLYWFCGRTAGYEKAVSEAGIRPMPPLVEEPLLLNPDSARENWAVSSHCHAGYLAEYFSTHGKPDAIMTLSDGNVPGVASACRILGLEPGRDIDIVGYDNYWNESPDREFDPYLPPFTVDKLNVEMGREMVRMLSRRKNGELPPEPQLRLMKPEVIKISM